MQPCNCAETCCRQSDFNKGVGAWACGNGNEHLIGLNGGMFWWLIEVLTAGEATIYFAQKKSCCFSLFIEPLHVI